MSTRLPRLLRHPSAFVGLAIVSMMSGLSIAAPQLTHHDPVKVQAGQALTAPNNRHPMGTDNLGRDVFARVVYGGRISLGYSSVATLLAALLGAPLGLLTGYLGGRLDALAMRAMDLLLAFPRLLLALVLVAILGVGLINVTVAITISTIPFFARVIRGTVITIRSEEFVTAAKAIGSPDWRIIWRHVLPNVVGHIIVLITLSLAASIFALSSLSFLGLGVQPPTPEWGVLASRGRDMMRDAWWMSIFPGLAIAVTVLGVNLLGDGLRDYFDPRMLASNSRSAREP